MKPLSLTGVVLMVASSIAACEPRTTLETEMQVSELESRLADLEVAIDEEYQQLYQVSQTLSARVRELELAVGDLDRRVLDLRGGDPQFTVPEMEAAVLMTRQRMEAVRAAANELQRMVTVNQ